MRESDRSPGLRTRPVLASAIVSLAILLGAAPVATRARADGPAPVPTAATRALETLSTRETILTNQAGMARVTARWRARELYRFLRASRDGESQEGVGAGAPSAALSAADRARVLTTGARALARELQEARLITAELGHARAEREALTSSAGASVQPREVGPAPPFRPPVAGPLVSRFGAARDPATGAWFFHAGVRLRARPGDAVRAVAPGRVARMVAASAQGPAILVDHGRGWTSLVTGVTAVAVAAGDRVAAGQVVGRAGPSDGIVLEIWRARTPVDPAAYLRF
jgi:murein DD-endopeptidase MepM/ murein hydrolase activator NlpD